MLVGGGPTWAQAYDTYFGINEAKVVCRQLGCPADEPVIADGTRLVYLECRPSYRLKNVGVIEEKTICLQKPRTSLYCRRKRYITILAKILRYFRLRASKV